MTSLKEAPRILGAGVLHQESWRVQADVSRSHGAVIVSAG